MSCLLWIARIACGNPLCSKDLIQNVVNAEQMMRFNRIERLANMVVAGDALDPKQRAGVVSAAGLFHSLLKAQERRALGEEDLKSRQNNIGHAVAGIVPSAPVGQSGGDTAQAFD
jgi:hypothetical protein